MNIFQAELKYYLRSPVIWLVMSISAFTSGWSFLISLDLFTRMQLKFATMSDAPTTTSGIVFPMISMQALIMMIIVAIIAGLSFSRLSGSNAWSMIISSRLSEWHIIRQKYLALLVISLLFMLPILLVTLSLSIISEVEILTVLIAIFGLILLVMWMLAVSMYISSLVNNTGFAIMLSLLIFLLLWFLSQSTAGSEWGKNWIQVLTPQYHFKQFISDYYTYASLFYFLSGIFLFLYACKIRLIHKRYVL